MKIILASSLIDLHTEGGPGMFLLTLMLIINIGLLIYSIFAPTQKKTLMSKYVEAIKQIGVLAAVFGSLYTIFGLFQAFNWLETHNEGASFQVIMGE
jgi:prepilin signal peptidase PulO-like enzyme (type II secretory pathway)